MTSMVETRPGSREYEQKLKQILNDITTKGLTLKRLMTIPRKTIQAVHEYGFPLLNMNRRGRYVMYLSGKAVSPLAPNDRVLRIILPWAFNQRRIHDAR